MAGANDGNGGHGDLGIKPTISVDLRIPKIPGADPQVLVEMARQIMGELQFWAPLEPPQSLADVAGAVLGDVPALEQIRAKMATAAPGNVVQVVIMRPSLIEPDTSEVELVLSAPVRLNECDGDTNAIASFVTIVGLLTSPTARGLLRLGGRRIAFNGPALPSDAS